MQRIRRQGFVLIGCALVFVPLTVQAGMPMPVLTDVAKARLEVISFFLAGYLALALFYQLLWNSMARDFSRLPRLSYRGALGVLVVCGSFIYVILTMISGARELMTPGAWARSDGIYSLREPEKDPKPWLDNARRVSLEKVRGWLWSYAGKHGGALPADRNDPEVPKDLWATIDPSGMPFVYLPGTKVDSGQRVIVYEPASFGAKRFALLASGEIISIALNDLTNRIKAEIESDDPGQRAR